jgi:hypothetical protein
MISVLGAIVLGQDPPNDVLINIETKGIVDLLGDAYAAKAGVAVFHVHNGRNQFR